MKAMVVAALLLCACASAKDDKKPSARPASEIVTGAGRIRGGGVRMDITIGASFARKPARGASTVIDVRLLGAASRIPLEPLRRLFPIMWAGFWINAISGVALFAADATTKGTTTVFLSKLVIIVLAVVVLMSIKKIVFGHGRAAENTTPMVRALAAVSLVLWLAAIATGRYMAYV